MLRMWFDLSWQHHYCVYCLTDPEGKRYFGISRYSAAKRWKNGKGYGGNRRLKNAIARYSFAGFRKEIIREGLTAAGLECFGGKNAPYIWLKTPDNMGSWDFFDLVLDKANVATTPGAGFGPSGEGYIRLTAFGDADATRAAVERIRTML